MPTKTILIGAGVLVVIIFLFIITRPKRDGGNNFSFLNLGLLLAIIFGAIKLFGKKEEESEDAKFIREEIAEREQKIEELKAKGDKVAGDIDRDKSTVEVLAKEIEELEEKKLQIEAPKEIEKKTVSQASKKLKNL